MPGLSTHSDQIRRGHIPGLGFLAELTLLSTVRSVQRRAHAAVGAQRPPNRSMSFHDIVVSTRRSSRAVLWQRFCVPVASPSVILKFGNTPHWRHSRGGIGSTGTSQVQMAAGCDVDSIAAARRVRAFTTHEYPGAPGSPP